MTTNTEIRNLNKVKFSKKDLENYFKIVWWFRSHPDHAVYKLFGIELTPHERILLRTALSGKYSSIIWLLGRGMAKTTMLWITALVTGLLYSKSQIPLLGPDFRRGKSIFLEIEKYLSGLVPGMSPTPFVLKSLVVNKAGGYVLHDQDMWRLQFSHGSVLVTAPLASSKLKDRSGVRGFRASRMMATDESADISQDIWDKVIKPFARVKQWGQKNYKFVTIQAGTIDVEGSRYYKEVQLHKKYSLQPETGYLFLEFNYEDAFFFTKPQEITYSNYLQVLKSKHLRYIYPIYLESILKERFEGDRYSYLLENKNVLVSTPDRVFPPVLIKKATGLRNPDGSFMDDVIFDDGQEILLPPGIISLKPYSDEISVIGVDVARSSLNDTAMVVLSYNEVDAKNYNVPPFWYVSSVVLLNNLNFEEQAIEIWKLLERFPNTILIHMDKRGGGMALADLLVKGKKDDSGNWQFLPIFDPDVQTPEDFVGKDILRLDASTDVLNEYRVMKARSLLERRQILFPYSNLRDIGHDLLEQEYAYLRELILQLTNVRKTATKQASKYYVEVGGNKRYKKDLFSAFLLAVDAIEQKDKYRMKEVAFGIWL